MLDSRPLAVMGAALRLPCTASSIAVGASCLGLRRFRRIKTSVVTYSAVISTFETAGRWREALHMLGLLTVEPNCYTYNSAISACEKACSWAHAVWLLREMRMRSLQLDLISYNAALSTCSVSSKWTLALSLMSEMSGYSLQMNAAWRQYSVCKRLWLVRCPRRGYYL